MDKAFNIEVTLVSCGNYALYNAYLPGGKHKVRLTQKIEDIYRDIATTPMPKGRYYLQLELGGSVKGEDDMDFIMPTTKYVFAKK